MSQGIDVIPSKDVSSSRKVCDYLEDEGFVKAGGLTFYLADYCGLGHLCDDIGDCMSDLELAEECSNHCFFIEFNLGNVVYYELHTDNPDAFKAELRSHILKVLDN
jgi:hypothetical protein